MACHQGRRVHLVWSRLGGCENSAMVSGGTGVRQVTSFFQFFALRKYKCKIADNTVHIQVG